MNPELELTEQLEAQSRAAIKAWCDDPSVQLEYCHKEKETWHIKDNCPAFDACAYYYRIAAEKKWYRVAKVKGGTFSVDSDLEEKMVKKQSNFIEWLDERKYYD